MLSNSRVTDNHKIAGPGGEPVNGSVHIHPSEQRKEEGTTQELRHVIQFSSGHGYTGVVLAHGERPAQRGQPVRAHPGAASGWFRVVV